MPRQLLISKLQRLKNTWMVIRSILVSYAGKFRAKAKKHLGSRKISFVNGSIRGMDPVSLKKCA
jgi:hypothetical protein